MKPYETIVFEFHRDDIFSNNFHFFQGFKFRMESAATEMTPEAQDLTQNAGSRNSSNLSELSHMLHKLSTVTLSWSMPDLSVKPNLQ